MRKLKIVYLANSQYIGGGNRSLFRMVQKFKKNHHEVLVFLPNKGDFESLLKKHNIKYYILDHRLFSGRSKLSLFLILFRYIKFFYFYAPDIIHANDLFCYYLASIAAKILKKALVCHMRFSVEQEDINYYIKVLPKVLIFNSFYLKTRFEQNNPGFPLSVKKEVVYNFFDPNEYYFPHVRNNIRRNWEADNYFLVGIIGNFSPQKGHDIFFNVATNLLDFSDSFRFVIVGKDLDSSKCNELKIKKLIRDLGLQKYVIWLGFQKNIGKILAGLDVLVVPSLYEPFGRVAVEGLLAGLPVVASRTGGLIEILENAPYAFLVQPGDVFGFSSVVKQIFRDGKKYPIISNREYAISRFSENANYKKLEKIYWNLFLNNTQ